MHHILVINFLEVLWKLSFITSQFFNEFICVLYKIVWLGFPCPAFDHLNIWFVDKIIVPTYLGFSSEVTSNYVEFVYVRSLAECYILSVFRCWFLLQLHHLALHHISGCKAIVAVIVKEQEVTGVKWFLNCFIWAVAPINTIIHITRPCCVFPTLDHFKVSILVFDAVAPVLEIQVIPTTSNSQDLTIQFECLKIWGHNLYL